MEQTGKKWLNRLNEVSLLEDAKPREEAGRGKFMKEIDVLSPLSSGDKIVITVRFSAHPS